MFPLYLEKLGNSGGHLPVSQAPEASSAPALNALVNQISETHEDSNAACMSIQGSQGKPDRTHALAISHFSLIPNWKYSCSRETAAWLWNQHHEIFEQLIVEKQMVGRKQGLIQALEDMGLIGWTYKNFFITRLGLGQLSPKMIQAILTEIPPSSLVRAGNVTLPFPLYQRCIELFTNTTATGDPFFGFREVQGQLLNPEEEPMTVRERLLELFQVTCHILKSDEGTTSYCLTDFVRKLRLSLIHDEALSDKFFDAYDTLRPLLEVPEKTALFECHYLKNQHASYDLQSEREWALVADFFEGSNAFDIRWEVLGKLPTNTNTLRRLAPYLFHEEKTAYLDALFAQVEDPLTVLVSLTNEKLLIEAIFDRMLELDFITYDPNRQTYNFSKMISRVPMDTIVDLLVPAGSHRVEFSNPIAASLPASKWLTAIQQAEGSFGKKELTKAWEVKLGDTTDYCCPALLAYESRYFKRLAERDQDFRLLGFSETVNSEMLRATHRHSFRLTNQPWELWRAFEAYEMRDHYLETLKHKIYSYVDINFLKGRHVDHSHTPQLAHWNLWETCKLPPPPPDLSLMELSELGSPLILFERIASRLTDQQKRTLPHNIENLSCEEKNALSNCVNRLLKKIEEKLLELTGDPEGVESTMGSLRASNKGLTTSLANVCAASLTLQQSWHVRAVRDLLSDYQTFALTTSKKGEPWFSVPSNIRALAIHILKGSNRTINSVTISELAKKTPKLQSLFIHGGGVQIGHHEGFSKLRSLTSLALIRCRVHPDEIGSWKMPIHLKGLFLDGIDLCPSSILGLLAQIQVQTLRLTRANLDERHIPIIQKASSVQALNLRDNPRLSPIAVWQLQICHNLKRLDISANIFSSQLERLHFINSFPNKTIFLC